MDVVDVGLVVIGSRETPGTLCDPSLGFLL